MRALPIGVAALLLALFPSIAISQVAQHQFIPIGNLFTATSNPSILGPEEKRIYGGYASAAATADYKDQTRLDFVYFGLAVGFDTSTDFANLSGGYSSARADSTFKLSWGEVDVVQNLTTLSGQFSKSVNENAVIAARLDSISSSIEYTFSNFSSKAQHEYFDITFGGSKPIAENLRFGVTISPQVTSKKTYDGTFFLPGTTSTAGHGHLISVGVGYLLTNLALGADVLMEAKNTQAQSESGTEGIFSADYLAFPTTSIFVNAAYFQGDGLKDDGDFVVPPSTGHEIYGGVRHILDPTTQTIVEFSGGFSRQQYNDYGEPTQDAERIDTIKTTAYSLILTTNL